MHPNVHSRTAWYCTATELMFTVSPSCPSICLPTRTPAFPTIRREDSAAMARSSRVCCAHVASTAILFAFVATAAAAPTPFHNTMPTSTRVDRKHGRADANGDEFPSFDRQVAAALSSSSSSSSPSVPRHDYHVSGREAESGEDEDGREEASVFVHAPTVAHSAKADDTFSLGKLWTGFQDWLGFGYRASYRREADDDDDRSSEIPDSLSSTRRRNSADDPRHESPDAIAPVFPSSSSHSTTESASTREGRLDRGRQATTEDELALEKAPADAGLEDDDINTSTFSKFDPSRDPNSAVRSMHGKPIEAEASGEDLSDDDVKRMVSTFHKFFFALDKKLTATSDFRASTSSSPFTGISDAAHDAAHLQGHVLTLSSKYKTKSRSESTTSSDNNTPSLQHEEADYHRRNSANDVTSDSQTLDAYRYVRKAGQDEKRDHKSPSFRNGDRFDREQEEVAEGKRNPTNDATGKKPLSLKHERGKVTLLGKPSSRIQGMYHSWAHAATKP
jgi:hypothetical protein